MEVGGAILSPMAQAISLGTASALLLAFIAACVLLTLEELWLRRWLHRAVVASWLESLASKELDARMQQLAAAISGPAPGEPARLESAPAVPTPVENARGSFNGVVDASASLPTRQMLGVLAASLQADLAGAMPSALARWLAAIGSMPIVPSPFAGLVPPDPITPTNEERARRTDSLRQLVQQYADRALDALQARIARATAKARYAVAVALVALVSAFFTGGPRFPRPGPGSVLDRVLELVAQTVLVMGPHVVVWLVAAAFVPILLAPLERLMQRSR